MEKLGLFGENTLGNLRLRLSRAKKTFPKIFSKTGNLESLRDMFGIPIMTKSDCLATSLPPNPENVLLFNSGGSSGQPSYYYLTPSDLCEKARIATELSLQGLNEPGERRYLYLNLMSGGGGWSGPIVCAVGHHRWCVNYSPVNRSTEETIRLSNIVIASLGDLLAGIILMGYPPRLLEIGQEMNKIEPKDRWRANRIVFGGGGLSRSQSDFLRSVFREATIHSILSSSEGNAYGYSFDNNLECLSVLPDSCFLWIRDETTGMQIEEPGVAGEIVVTSLYGEYLPMNFLSNDRAEWIEPYQTYRMLGRRKDIISFAEGCTRFQGQDLEEIILQRSGASACQIHLYPGPLLDIIVSKPDRILSEPELQQALSDAAKLSNVDALRSRVKVRMRQAQMEKTSTGKTPLVIDHLNV